MIRVIYRAGPGLDPPLLDTYLSAPPEENEIIEIDLDSLNLRAYAPATQESLRLANVECWRVTSCRRILRSVSHASPSAAADQHEAILQPVLGLGQPRSTTKTTDE